MAVKYKNLKTLFYFICFFALVSGLMIFFSGYSNYGFHREFQELIHDSDYTSDLQNENEDITDEDIAKYQEDIDTIVTLDELQMRYGIILSVISVVLLWGCFSLWLIERVRAKNGLDMVCPHCRCRIPSGIPKCPFCENKIEDPMLSG